MSAGSVFTEPSSSLTSHHHTHRVLEDKSPQRMEEAIIIGHQAQAERQTLIEMSRDKLNIKSSSEEKQTEIPMHTMIRLL